MARTVPTLSILPLRDDDRPFVVELGRRAFAAWSRDPGATVEAMLEERGAHTCVAWYGARPVGFAVVVVRRLPRPCGPWSTPTVGRLEAIALRRDAEGRGIGRALLHHATGLAEREGCVVLTLMTARQNVRARRLFQRAGFLATLAAKRGYANGDIAIDMFRLLDRG